MVIQCRRIVFVPDDSKNFFSKKSAWSVHGYSLVTCLSTPGNFFWIIIDNLCNRAFQNNKKRSIHNLAILCPCYRFSAFQQAVAEVSAMIYKLRRVPTRWGTHVDFFRKMTLGFCETSWTEPIMYSIFILVITHWGHTNIIRRKNENLRKKSLSNSKKVSKPWIFFNTKRCAQKSWKLHGE